MGTSDTLLEWQEPAGGGVADAAAADGRHAAAVPGDAGGRQVRRRDARDVCGGAGVHARRGAAPVLLSACLLAPVYRYRRIRAILPLFIVDIDALSAVVLLLSCFSELFSRAFLVAGCRAQCVYICEEVLRMPN